MPRGCLVGEYASAAARIAVPQSAGWSALFDAEQTSTIQTAGNVAPVDGTPVTLWRPNAGTANTWTIQSIHGSIVYRHNNPTDRRFGVAVEPQSFMGIVNPGVSLLNDFTAYFVVTVRSMVVSAYPNVFKQLYAPGSDLRYTDLYGDWGSSGRFFTFRQKFDPGSSTATQESMSDLPMVEGGTYVVACAATTNQMKTYRGVDAGNAHIWYYTALTGKNPVEQTLTGDIWFNGPTVGTVLSPEMGYIYHEIRLYNAYHTDAVMQSTYSNLKTKWGADW